MGDPVLRAHFAFQGDFDFQFEGLDKISLKKEYAVMYFSPYLKGVGTFKKGNTYVLLDITYKIEMLRALAYFFPVLLPFIEKVEHNEPSLLPPGFIVPLPPTYVSGVVPVP